VSGALHVHGRAVRSNGCGKAEECLSPKGVIEPARKLRSLATRNLRFRELFKRSSEPPTHLGGSCGRGLLTPTTETEFFLDADPKKASYSPAGALSEGNRASDKRRGGATHRCGESSMA